VAWNQRRASGGAPGRGEKIEAGEGMRGSLVSPDFRVLPAAMANSGEESGQPGGAVGSGIGGELVRRSRASYSRGDASIMTGSKGN
jgi:hypothetical protein